MVSDCAVAKMAQAGKYLSFRLAGQEYGLEILKIQEIVAGNGISPLPLAPDHVRGMIRLRGRNLPVVDMRRLFRLGSVQESDKSCVVVAQIPFLGSLATVGLLVDEVCEVLNLGQAEIHFPPTWAGGMEEPDFINGMGQVDDRRVILLESESFFSEEELKAVVVWDEEYADS